MIQIRNVSDDVHRTLKVRAAQAGMSLSDYLLKELEKVAARPSRDEWLRRLAALPTVDVTTDEIVAAIREERDGR